VLAWIGGVLILIAVLLGQILVFLLCAAFYASWEGASNEHPVDFANSRT